MSAKRIFIRQFFICLIIFGVAISTAKYISSQYIDNDTGARRRLAVETALQQQNSQSHELANLLQDRLQHLAKVAKATSHDVIFDNDAAPDDAAALALIANDPRVNLKLITVSGTGEAHAQKGAENMVDMTYFLGIPNVPVAYGRSSPLSKAGTAFPGFIRKAIDQLLTGKEVARHKEKRPLGNAVLSMKKVLEKNQRPVVILATGPLTNVAELISKFPHVTNKIERIVVMGGAIFVPGNINVMLPSSKNTVSEWNFYADPEAANIVLSSTVPVTLISLDATSQVPMTREFYASLAKQTEPDLKFIYRLNEDVVKRFGMDAYLSHYYLWDALAAMLLVDPDIAEVTRAPLLVDRTNGRLQLVDDKKGKIIDVVTRIQNPNRVLLNYVATIKSNHIYAQRQFKRALWHKSASALNNKKNTGDAANVVKASNQYN